MSKQTPGPWIFVPAGGNNEWSYDDDSDMGGFRSSDHWVCRFGDCTTYYPSEGTPPNEADSRLIAAAPDLLRAAEKAMADMAWAESAVPGTNFQSSLILLRSAIAKATGTNNHNGE